MEAELCPSCDRGDGASEALPRRSADGHYSVLAHRTLHVSSSNSTNCQWRLLEKVLYNGTGWMES